MKLIDRDKLYNTICKQSDLPDDVINVCEIRLAIINQPMVDAEPVRHGKWKPMDLTWGRSIYYCTNCRESLEVPTEMGKPIYRFCPSCGAKMDGEKENG